MNANLNALQKLGLMFPSNPSQSLPPANNTNKEANSSQISRNMNTSQIPISQEVQKDGGANPFSGLRNQLQNLATKQKFSSLKAANNNSPPSFQATNIKENNTATIDNKLMNLFGLGSNPIKPPNFSQSSIKNPNALSLLKTPISEENEVFQDLLNFDSSEPKKYMTQTNFKDDFQDLDDYCQILKPSNLSKNPEASFGFGTPMNQQHNITQPENYPEFVEIPSQISDSVFFQTQKKVKQSNEVFNDSTKYTINLSQVKSPPKPAFNFTQNSKMEILNNGTQNYRANLLNTEASATKNERSQNLRRGSPLFKVKQQSKNQKIVNLATNFAWSKALTHIGINPNNNLIGGAANQAIVNSLNEIDFYTINQIKSNLIINLKVSNILVALKTFETHKDTVTLILMDEDLTGEITASIVKSAISEEISNSIYLASQKDTSQQNIGYRPGDKIFLKVGTVMILKNVTVFSPCEETHYLTISQNNIEYVFYE